jgi:hypothetical protein
LFQRLLSSALSICFHLKVSFGLRRRVARATGLADCWLGEQLKIHSIYSWHKFCATLFHSNGYVHGLLWRNVVWATFLATFLTETVLHLHTSTYFLTKCGLGNILGNFFTETVTYEHK